MRVLLILSLFLSPVALTAGCATDDDDVTYRKTQTTVTQDGDGDRKVTKTEKTTRVDD